MLQVEKRKSKLYSLFILISNIQHFFFGVLKKRFASSKTLLLM
ncbi:hypothetical protein CUPA0106 [Campylobacter upsaliensis RM3195]|nr:hypothetical protein CUPA0106 [Campylobacter upsaliensis RM3195]